jgi:positive regulator of sigma E activity
MEFMIGFLFILPLIGLMLGYDLISKLIPKELVISVIYGLILADGTLAAVWYFGIVELMEKVKLFKLGMAAAFMGGTVVKVSYFAIKKVI